MQKYLVIVRAGNNSLHKHWIKDIESKNFDLFISYYGDDDQRYADDADYYEQEKGGKWPILSKIIQQQAELINQYDAVWMPDDDILMSTGDINRMFALFVAYELELAQPALTLDSYAVHKHLLVANGSTLRFCNFVEVMAPVFSRQGLEKLKPTFSQSPSGWGLDLLWPWILKNKTKKNIGVIDATPMIHTRPVGGELYKKNPELSPMKDISKLASLYPDAGIDAGNLKVKFKVYGQVKNSDSQSDLHAFIRGYIQRKIANKSSRKVVKYNNKDTD